MLWQRTRITVTSNCLASSDFFTIAIAWGSDFIKLRKNELGNIV